MAPETCSCCASPGGLEACGSDRTSYHGGLRSADAVAADEAYPASEKIRVVLDNLNTHKPASLYETFEPKEARRIRKRLEFHYTPKHGSWLNMAEIEFSVLARRVLRRRIADEETLSGEIAALEAERNQAGATIDWRFSTVDARVKLHHLYPANN